MQINWTGYPGFMLMVIKVGQGSHVRAPQTAEGTANGEHSSEDRDVVSQARRHWVETVDAISDPLMVHDAQFRIVRCNRAYAARAQMSFKDIIGKPYWDCFPRRSGPISTEEFKLETGEIFVCRSYHIAGHEKLNVFANVTERRHAEEQLRLANAVIETSSSVLYRAALGVEGAVRYVSSNLRRYGYQPEDLISGALAYSQLIHPDDCASVLEAFERNVSAGAKSFVLEYRVVARNGEKHWVEDHIVIKYDDKGQPLYQEGVLHDVTERHAAEAKIRILARFPEENPNAVMRVAADGMVMYANPASAPVQAYCGATPGQRVNPMCMETVRRCLDAGKVFLGEFSHAGRTFSLTFAPVNTERYVNVYGTDITAQKAAADALKRANRGLRTLTAANEALVRARDEPELLKTMCQILTTVGGYRIAFVGYALHDGAKSIDAVASSGAEETFLRSLAISWNEHGQTAVGRAVREARVHVIRDVANCDADPEWRRRLGERGIKTVVGLPLQLAPGAAPIGAIGIASEPKDVFDAEELGLLEKLASDLAYGIASLRSDAERRAGAEKLRRGLENTLGAIVATMETRDPYTAGHQRRVADLAAAIATEMGLPGNTVEGVRFGALIHDLGKIQVPAEILAKPTRLTKLEFELIKTHPQAGYEIIKGIEFPWPVAQMVRQHHERLDGTGYPEGAKGDAIALEARILAVADVVEAMASHRPYRAGLGIDVALKEIEDKRGRWFDPAAVDACLRLFREKRFTFPSDTR